MFVPWSVPESKTTDRSEKQVATRVCTESELVLGAAIKVMVNGVAVALGRNSAGSCFAFGDMCSHADLSLSRASWKATP